MKCIYCNTTLASIAYCPGCGRDVTLQKRIARISNLLYNKGLEKAQVRDLSGAIGCLKQSLKFNKENIDARNLLGLCYFETGEAVLALCEWVISRNMKPADNLAEKYLNELQNNKNQLDNINQSIRKYNQSIEYARQGHEDMAIMQLRKVVSSNPKLVKAKQLLALLYLKNGEPDKARRQLKKALAIDNANTMTLRYLAEAEKGKSTRPAPLFGRKDEDWQDAEETIRYVSDNETIIQPTTFRDSSAIATLINIGLGMLLGGAVIWFLVVPANKQKASEEANAQVTTAALSQSSASAQLSDLQSEITDLTGQVESANAERDAANAKTDSYDTLLAVANAFIAGETTTAISALQQLEADSYEGSAKDLYDSLVSSSAAAMFTEYYTAGTTAYVSGNYTEAASQLQAAVDSDPNGEQGNYADALYYLGFAYYNVGNSDKADEIFHQFMDKYPGRAGEVSPYLSTAVNTAGSQNQGQTAQDNISGQTQSGGSGDATIQIYGDDAANGTSGTVSYDPSQVAWTDPTTGLHYDVYGNLLG